MNNQLVSSSSFSSPPSWKYDERIHAAILQIIYTRHWSIRESTPSLIANLQNEKQYHQHSSKQLKSQGFLLWCLDELVEILQCRESKQQIVLPVFYKVDPSHVRSQISSFGDAFTELECKFKDNKEKILAWRRALREAANLSGHPFRKGEYIYLFPLLLCVMNIKKFKLLVPQDCIEVVVKNAIITIEGNKILMHGLLEKVGKHIVWEESPTEPDVYHVLTENKGTKKIRGIVVELPEHDVIPLNVQSFLQMVNLDIFVHNALYSRRICYLPNDLRWIELGLPFNIERKHTVVFNLPSNYHPGYLVRFDVSYSGIRQLKGFENLAKLSNMNFSGCEFLEKIPDFSKIPSIKHLDLSECKSLVEVDDSIGFLDKLLTRFAKRLGLRSLEKLCLSGCTKLESFPEIEEDKMESLIKKCIRELPSSIAYLTGLQRLDAELIATDLDTLDDYCVTLTLPKLDYRDLEGCSLSEIDFLVPLDCWFTIRSLNLSQNNFASLPECISNFI
ncbi:hypothetical protein DVH24_034054 [Malus domestica]|uniref:TIR domain-containing protein n=1 Tax=Malus domestica TaxID=3750 RepID=A0A498KPB9_MALDO|nr:hypothetical protein DVH24_034054 [Malus domestica]